jgi:hypothetical protein
MGIRQSPSWPVALLASESPGPGCWVEQAHTSTREQVRRVSRRNAVMPIGRTMPAGGSRHYERPLIGYLLH